MERMKSKPEAEEQYNPDILRRLNKDEEKKKKKVNMTSIFVIPDSSKYKQHLHKREKETNKMIKDRKKDEVSPKKAPLIPVKGK